MSDPEMTTFGMYPNWCIEYCKAYAEQLKDETRANRAVHAAECIEYLLSLVQKEWVGLTEEEVKACAKGGRSIGISFHDAIQKAEAKLREKNHG